MSAPVAAQAPVALARLPDTVHPHSRELSVASYKVEQRHLTFRGRQFHFVSYEGRPANERRGEQAEPPMWCLMNEGKRHPVMPQVLGQEPAEVDQALLTWVQEQIPAPTPGRPLPRRPF